MSYNYPPAGGPVYSSPPPKKKKVWPWVLLGVGLVVLSCIIGTFVTVSKTVDSVDKELNKIEASSTTDSAEVAKNVHKFGEVVTVKYNNGEATVQITEVKQVNNKVVANVIFNGIKGQVPYNPMYFKWRNSDGTESNGGFADYRAPMQSGTVLPGAKAQGVLAFENAKLDGGQLQETNAILDTIVTWVS